MIALTCPPAPAYADCVATLLAIGFGDPTENLAHKRPVESLQALFLCPQRRSMVATCGRPQGLPGSKFPVRQPARSHHPTRLATGRGDSSFKLGVSQMSITTQGAPAPSLLSRSLAAAHRRMAMAALRADSSASVRLARYNAHMTKARGLEVRHG